MKSQLEFYVGSMSNLRTPFGLFLIQAGFKSGLNSYGSQFITVTGPTFLLFSPFFSLSSRSFSASLSYSRPLQSPYTAPFFFHYKAPYSHNSFSKTKQKLQHHIRPDQWTLKNDFTNFISFHKILSKKNQNHSNSSIC